jgi:hypothetical protein
MAARKRKENKVRYRRLTENIIDVIHRKEKKKQKEENV